jgi:hypothetical protein
VIRTAAGLATIAALYIGAYLAICEVRPEGLNTNDGPKKPFLTLFYPLRHLSAVTPDFVLAAEKHGSSLVAVIEEINYGNGYLYFTWAGGTARAAFTTRVEHLHVGDKVLIHFRSELLTYDDFQSHRVPLIDEVRAATATSVPG